VSDSHATTKLTKWLIALDRGGGVVLSLHGVRTFGKQRNWHRVRG